MKKSLLLFLVAALPLLAWAGVKVERNPRAVHPLSMDKRMAKAPKYINLNAYELVLGNYDSDAVAGSDEGVGLPGYPGTLSIAAAVPKGIVAMFKDGKVKRIRIGLANGGVQVNKVFMIKLTARGTISTASTDTIASATVGRTLNAGWNEFEVEGTIDATAASRGVAIGYEYVQVNTNNGQSYNDECFPISTVDEGNIQATYVKGLPGYTTWVDIGLQDYGNMSVQAVVENENFPQYNITLGNFSAVPFAKSGDTLPFAFEAANKGVGQVERFNVNLLADGEPVESLDFEGPLSLTPAEFSGSITVPSTLAQGAHTLRLEVARINGEATEEVVAAETTLHVYSYAFERQKQLVEHITSHSCTYCPLGENMLKKLEALRDDIAWVSIHGNQSQTDPFNNTKANQMFSLLGANFFPGAVFNRVDIEGEGSLPVSIGYYEQYAQQVADMFSDIIDENPTPALATVNIDATLNKATRQLDITVSGDVVEGLSEMFNDKVGFTVYITEDTLVNRQLNQGTWVNDFTHNHVMRDRLTTAAVGDAINMVSPVAYENTLTTTLNEAWNLKNLRIIAFVSRTQGGTALQVFNTELLNVKDIITDDPLQGDVDGNGLVNGTDVTALYNYLLNGVTPAGDADVDGNGTVNGTDVTALYNILLNNE